jgi:hypothetical protein
MPSPVRYDWHAIRAMWEAGEAANSIAQKDGMPCKQAICQRANKEHWERIDGLDAELEVIPFEGLDDRQRTVVTRMAKGLPQKWAAAYAGVSEDTVTRWKQGNEAFAAALRAATAVFVDKQLGKVAESTDWRSGLALMERHPATRGEFVPPNAGRPAGQFNFNVLGQVSVGFDRDNHGLPSQRNELIAVDVGGDSHEPARISRTGIELAP